MSKNTSIHFVLVIACTLLFLGCSENASEEIDFGTIENSVYKNDYFGLTLTIPENWSVPNQESRQQLMKIEKEVIAGEDENLKAVMNAAELQSVNLLFLSKHPLGSPVAFNPNIVSVAEKIQHMPGIKRGKDYLYHSKILLESTKLDVSFPEEISTVTLGGVEFDVMYVHMTVLGNTVKQEYFATIKKGYALTLILSYLTDEDKADLVKVLDSIVFE